MGSISAFLKSLFNSGGNSNKSILTERDFAEVFLNTIVKKHPSIKFNLNDDLSISAKTEGLAFNLFLDNAYDTYKAEPDSMKEIISNYITSATELFEQPQGVNLDQVIPIIKPVEFLDEVKKLNKDNTSVKVVTEKYNDQLIIAYVEDTQNNIKYLKEDDFNALSISRDELKSIALRNFDKIIPNIERHGDEGLYLITAGGDYEASLILISSIWTKENFPVDGEFVVAIPNRDMLIVTGSKSKKGIAKIVDIMTDSYKTGNYQVSDQLFMWDGNRFEKYLETMPPTTNFNSNQ